MRLRGKALPALVVGIVAMVVLAGCGAGGLYGSGSKSTPAPAPTSPVGAGGGVGGGTVSIQNFAFSPQTLTVKVGTKVTWMNNDSAPHTVTSASNKSVSATPTGLFDSGQLAPGRTFSFTFTKAGTYFYECTIHKAMPAMHGEIVVK